MTEQQNEYIKQHYNKTYTAAQIGKELGMTRGAVIGRAYRMGLGAPGPAFGSVNADINARFLLKTQAIMDKRVGA